MRRSPAHARVARALASLILMLAAVGAPWRAAHACDCVCYFSSDCAADEFCEYKGCTHVTVNGKLKDGLCKKRKPGGFSTDDLSNAAQAINLRLQAYEVAGAGGGGPPDAGLIAAAQSVPLTAAQHEHIRKFAVSVLVAGLGLATFEDPEPHLLGYFTPPATPATCTNPYAPGDDGAVAALDACHLAVAQRIRQAIVSEIQSPRQGLFDANMALIPIECAGYATFGRCEYPHPVEHGHPFPYADGQVCLRTELRHAVNSILPSSLPAESEWSLLAMAALLLAGATTVVARRRRAVTEG